MIYEYRHYVVREGQMDKLHQAFKKDLIPLFEKLGIKAIAFWEPQETDGRTYIYLLRFDSPEHREKAWKDFLADETWLKRKAELGDKPPVQDIQATVLVPTPYSPLP
jgi:hypothetical protein